jgi:Enoyl-(Acyl carrier protein) reductase
MTEDTMRRRGAAILAQVPFRRMGNPEEIAEMVVWLCSDRASYVSGAAYNVDRWRMDGNLTPAPPVSRDDHRRKSSGPKVAGLPRAAL